MKRCSKCGKTKPRSQFHKNSCQADGLTGWCRKCRAAAARTSYRRNVEKVRLYGAQRLSAQRTRAIREWGGRCSRCKKYRQTPWVLEFHHNDPVAETKVRRVHWGWKWLRIFTALCGCSLVCANCHKTIHHLLRKGDKP